MRRSQFRKPSAMSAAEILVALIAVLAGFALVSMFSDLWRKRPSDAPRDEHERKDGGGQAPR
jgi:hypothetical protein